MVGGNATVGNGVKREATLGMTLGGRQASSGPVPILQVVSLLTYHVRVSRYG